MDGFKEWKNLFEFREEIDSLMRDQEKKEKMGKATFWIVAAFLVLVVIGKIGSNSNA